MSIFKAYRKWLLVLGIISVLLVPAACTSTSTTTPAPTTTPMPMPTVTTTPPPATTTPIPPPATGQSVTIDLAAKNLAFDKSTITVPAGAQVTINFNNQDAISHNFALYTDSSASKSIFVGQTISASTTVYKFTAPTTPGTYFFRCDVHPSIMNGKFIVQ
ncbi:MAG: cupredoxin domain-containing protein [Dehalococcoidales bacterium]